MTTFPLFQYFTGMLYATYFLITLLLGLELAFNLFQYKNYRASAFIKIIGAMFLVDAFAMFLGATINTIWPSTLLSYTIRICDIIVILLLILSGFSLTSVKFPSRRVVLSLLIPTVVLTIIGLTIENSTSWATLAGQGFFIVFFVVLIFRLHRYDKRLEDYYSNTEDRHTFWFIFFAVWCLLEFPTYYFLNTKKIYGDMGVCVFYIIVLLFYLVLAHLSLKQQPPEVEDDLEIDNLQIAKELDKEPVTGNEKQPKEPVTDSSERLTTDKQTETANENKSEGILTQEQINEITYKLQRVMEDEKIYLNSELNTLELARSIRSNTKYLYYYLHEILHLRFYEYVNHFRIADAKEMMLSTEEKIEYIALSCGFKSYNTFAKAFKKEEGTYPNIWRNEKKQ